MKKRDQRLSLHRETLLQLTQELEPKALRKVNAAIAGDVSSCIQPRCQGLEPY